MTAIFRPLTKTSSPSDWVKMIDEKKISPKFFKMCNWSIYEQNWRGLFETMIKLEEQGEEINAVNIFTNSDHEVLKLYVGSL